MARNLLIVTFALLAVFSGTCGVALAGTRAPKDHGKGPSPTPAAASAVKSPTPAPVAEAKPTPVPINQNAQVIVLGYHRLVSKVKRPDTEISATDFEAQMQQLKEKGISVIPLQQVLAWERGEKDIRPRAQYSPSMTAGSRSTRSPGPFSRNTATHLRYLFTPTTCAVARNPAANPSPGSNWRRCATPGWTSRGIRSPTTI